MNKENEPTMDKQASLSNLEFSEECMICTDSKRDTLIKPCNHVIACNACSLRCKKCLLCKEAIQERVKLEECLICSEKKSFVLVEPCGHMVTCENCSKLIKKCIQCREPIEKKTTYTECCVDNRPVVDQIKNNNSLLSSPRLSTSGSFSRKSTQPNELENLKDMKKLQQQLHEIKEHVRMINH